MKRVLHVGCGPSDIKSLPRFFHVGWQEVRLDIDPRANPDIQASITDMRGAQTASFDAVYCSHNLEHVHLHEVPVALREFRRVLNDDGFAFIIVPDLLAASRVIIERGLHEKVYDSTSGPITPFDMLYGHAGLVQRTPFMMHKCGFTVQSMKAALYPFFHFIVTANKGHDIVAAGFVNVPDEKIGMERFRSIAM